MKALLLEEYKKLTVTDMPQPKCGDHDVLVQIKACGICGSDIHGFDGSSGRRVPPLIMGHEAAGVAAKTGTAVSSVKEGDRITFDSMVSCGECYFCKRSEKNLCENRRVLGVSCEDYRQHGCFAEYAVVPEHIVYPMPDNLPFEHAAMIEPVSVAVHAVKRTPIAKGDTAAVVGAGMIGLLVVQALKAAGCSEVIAVDLADEKLKLAQTLGATLGINPKSTDAVQAIRDATDGRGADVAAHGQARGVLRRHAGGRGRAGARGDQRRARGGDRQGGGQRRQLQRGQDPDPEPHHHLEGASLEKKVFDKEYF